MKIGIETSSLGSKYTGTSRYLSCLLEQLEKTSNQIIRFNSNDLFERNNPVSRVRKVLYRNYSLPKYINKSDAGCVIFPDYYMPSSINKKSAVIIHDLSFISHPQFYPKYFSAYYNFQIKKTLKQKPLIVTVSEHSRNNIVKYLNLKEDDILLVQAYSKLRSINVIKSGNSKNVKPYLLYVGHIEPRKNLNFMIEGFLRWKEKTGEDYKLKIVGEFWIRKPSTMALIKNYYNHPDVEFKGYISEEELDRAYSNAAGFLHTSLEEGFGFPVLEAMHYNLPVLCSEKISTAEISGPESVKVNPNNINNYLEGLEKLFNIIKNYNHVEYDIKYSPEKTMQQLAVLLDKLNNRDKRFYPVEIPKARNQREALEKTLIYAGLFNSGIREDKLRQQIFEIELTENELSNTIARMILEGKVIKKEELLFINYNKEGYYFRKERRINKKKVRCLLWFLKNLPFASMIAFSGGTSQYGILNHDDIDLFIITRPNTVYIAYFLIHLFSFVFHARKELCANYLIDETNLRITYSHDLYTAHQIISLIPFRNEQVLNLFWNENDWVKKFFPNFNFERSKEKKSYSNFTFIKPLNLLVMFFYKRLYRKKIFSAGNKGSLILKENCLKLHTNDHREKVISEFRDTLQSYYQSEYINRELEGKRNLETVNS